MQFIVQLQHLLSTSPTIMSQFCNKLWTSRHSNIQKPNFLINPRIHWGRTLPNTSFFFLRRQLTQCETHASPDGVAHQLLCTGWSISVHGDRQTDTSDEDNDSQDKVEKGGRQRLTGWRDRFSEESFLSNNKSSFSSFARKGTKIYQIKSATLFLSHFKVRIDPRL